MENQWWQRPRVPQKEQSSSCEFVLHPRFAAEEMRSKKGEDGALDDADEDFVRRCLHYSIHACNPEHKVSR